MDPIVPKGPPKSTSSVRWPPILSVLKAHENAALADFDFALAVAAPQIAGNVLPREDRLGDVVGKHHVDYIKGRQEACPYILSSS